MRVRSTEDENDDIMDASEALSMADDTEDSTYFLENDMAAVKKTPVAKSTPVKDQDVKAPKAVKAAKDPAVKGVFGPRAIPEGHVGIHALATELGISPSVARRNLRGMEGMTKPEGQHGWYWKDGSKELTALRKKLAA